MKSQLLSLIFICTAILGFSQTTNDECVNASAIGDINNEIQIIYNNTGNSTSALASCDNTNFTWLDQWFSFTMPLEGLVRISNANASDTFTLYDSCTGTELDCSLGSDTFVNLTLGANYILKVATRNTLVFNKLFRIQAIIPAVNDECDAAITLPVETANAINTSYNNAGSTLSSIGACENNNIVDMWFEFTMPVNGNVRVTEAFNFDGFVLYDTCNGTELQCGESDEYFLDLQQGANYKLKVSSRVTFIGTRSFNIQAFEVTVNDACDAAITLAIETATPINTLYNNAGSTSSVSGTCEPINFVDSWYEFTMPLTGNVRVTNAYSNDFFILYDSCNGTELQCGIGNEYYIGLQQGENYKLKVTSRLDLIATRSFNIQAFEPVVNDECDAAITLPIETANVINTSYNNAGSTLSVSGDCENSIYVDSWYEFTMPVNGNVRLTDAFNSDIFVLYDGCNSTELQCGFGDEYFISLQQGIIYKLKVTSAIDAAIARTFNIQAFEVTVNDECDAAIILPIETANAFNVEYDNSGSTLSVSTSCESTSIYVDSWYEFTMPVNGNISITGAFINAYFGLYDGCSGTELYCGNFNEEFINLQQGTNYKLKVSSRINVVAPRSFNIQAIEVTINDECNTAILLPIETANAVNVVYNNGGSTLSVSASCETNGTYVDSWYEFTMPVNGNVGITAAFGSEAFVVYNGCSGTELQCAEGSNKMYFLNLQQGTTYKLKVSSLVNLIATRSFNIQAFEELPNKTCTTATIIQVANIDDCALQNTIVDMQRAEPSTNLSSCVNQTSEYYEAWYTFESPLTGNIALNTSSNSDFYTLYDACNGTEIVCFNNDGSMPVAFGNTYYLQLLKNAVFIDNEVTFCLEGTPEVAQGVTDVCEQLPEVTISVAEGNTNDWVPIIDASGNIAAAINANGNDLGVISTSLFIDAEDIRLSDTQPYLRREVVITPENQPTTDVQIRLFILEDEMLDLIAVDPNLSDYFFLKIMKVSGSDCTIGYSSGGEFINVNIVSLYGSDYYSEFTTDSFSVFYPTSRSLENTLAIETLHTLDVSIYPTISNGIISIKSEDHLGASNLSVFDLNGRLIQTVEVELSSSPIQINLEGISKGLYYLKIENFGNIKTQKIILK